jgi:hypothetical protein
MAFDRDDQTWLPDKYVEALVCERVAEPEVSDEERARKVLIEAAPLAARSIKWLALYSGNENVRLRAAQYIIDGVVGGTWKGSGSEDDLLLQFVAQLHEDEEDAIKKATQQLR